jgi:hypothetical protein
MDYRPLFEIVDNRKGKIVGLKTKSSMLRSSFDQTLETAESILGEGVRPFPLELKSHSWILTNPQDPKLSGKRSLHDSKGHLVAASEKYLDWKGRNLREMIGKCSYEDVRPRELQKIKESHNEVLKGNETEFTFKALCKGNSRRDNTCRAIPIDNPSGSKPYSLILHGVS